MHSYPNLHQEHGLEIGIHLAPRHYRHKWLAVGRHSTRGADSLKEAVAIRAEQRFTEEGRAAA